MDERAELAADEVYEIRRRHRAGIPDLYKGAHRRLGDKAMTGKSLRAAVKSKCLDCMYWQATEVKACLSLQFGLRPQ